MSVKLNHIQNMNQNINMNLNDVSMAQSDLSEMHKTKYQKAEWSEGLKYAERHQILDNSKEEPKPFDLTCDIEKLKKYGIGLFFYLDLLQKIAIFFVIASIICLPVFYSNYTGEGLTKNTSGLFILSKLSLANQPQVKVVIPSSSATTEEKALIQAENDQNVKDFVSEQAERKYYVWIPDMVYSALFFLFIIYYNRFTSQQISLQKKSIQPSQYCVEIKGLPRNTLDSQELKVFINSIFSKFTKNAEPLVVMEISYVKDFKDTLFLHRKESEMIEMINIEKKKLEIQNLETNEELTKKELKLREIQEEIDKIVLKKLGGNSEYRFYETLSAYVVFNTFEQKQQFTELYEKYNNPNWIVKYLLCCFNSKMPEGLKFRGMYELQVNPYVDQPSNIMWENLDIKTGSRVLRGIVVFFIMLVVMLITLATLVAANAVQPQNSTSCPSNSYTMEQAKLQNTSSSQYCYCTSIKATEILTDSDIKDYCWETYLSYIQVQGLIIATSFAIVVVNIILVRILKKITSFLRFPNMTTQITSTAILLFICTFINTALLTLLLQSDIFGFITAVYFTSPIPPLREIQDSKTQSFSSDFDRDWYQKVGQKMLLTMIFSIIYPHIIDWMLTPLKKCMRQSKAQKKIIQLEMNKLMTGPEINLTAHYTSFMNVVFVCLFYSSGQPLLIPCAAVSLTIQYWIFKYKILRWYKKPPSFDDILNRSMLKVLPWSLMFHLAIGIYMYGQPLIFPRNSNQISITISDTLNTAKVYEVVVSSSQSTPVVDRTYSSIILFILLAIILAFYIADVAIIKILKGIFSKIFPCCFRGDTKLKITAIEESDPTLLTYSNQYKKMGQLASYDIKMNEDYYALIQAIDVGSQNLSNTPRSVSTPKNFGDTTTGKVEVKKSKFQQQQQVFNSSENFIGKSHNQQFGDFQNLNE